MEFDGVAGTGVWRGVRGDAAWPPATEGTFVEGVFGVSACLPMTTSGLAVGKGSGNGETEMAEMVAE